MQRRSDRGLLTSGRRSGFQRWLLGAGALVLAPLLLVSCTSRETRVVADTRVGSAPAGVTPVSVRLGELLDEPGRYAGQTVTVSGEVNDVLGPKAFTIGGEEFLPPGELLVVSPTGFPQIPDRPADEYLVDDDIVQVTGTVRTFVRTEVARQVDAGDLEGAAYVRWEGKPVLVVSSMVTTPRASGSARATAPPVTDVLVIVTAPDRRPLVGKTVRFTGVKVQSVVGDRAFWIGPSSTQRLFVVLDETTPSGASKEGRVNVDPGQTISLTGTIRKLPLPEAARQQWGLTEADLAPLKNEAIYVAADRVEVLKGS